MGKSCSNRYFSWPGVIGKIISYVIFQLCLGLDLVFDQEAIKIDRGKNLARHFSPALHRPSQQVAKNSWMDFIIVKVIMQSTGSHQ